MDLRALAESIEKEGRLRQKWEDTYSLKQSATLSKLGLRGFTPLAEKPNAVPHPAAGQRSLEPGPHKTRPNRSTPMATPPQRNAAILQSGGTMAPLPLPLHRAVNLKNRSIGTPLPQPPQRRPAAEVMQFTRLATADRARARNRDSSQTAEAMAADNAALASELRERHRIATAQRLGTAGSMGMAAPGGTPGGDQANSMVLNLDNPEESTLEVLRMELAKLDEDDEDAKSEVGTPEEEALTEALLRMAPPACAEEDSAVDKALKRRFKVKWPLAS